MTTEHLRSDESTIPEVPGVLSSADVLATAHAIADCAAGRRHDPLVRGGPLRSVEPRGSSHGPLGVWAHQARRWRPTAGWPTVSCPTEAGSTTTRVRG
jgi:hypothetical protein